MNIELAANWYRTRRHYSDDLEPSGGGRKGLSLCSTAGNPVQVFDAAAHAAFDKTYGMEPKSITDLPLCARCKRRAAKLDGVA